MTSSNLQSNNPSYTGSFEDPQNGPAVAASIFTAVIVYAVRCLSTGDSPLTD